MGKITLLKNSPDLREDPRAITLLHTAKTAWDKERACDVEACATKRWFLNPDGSVRVEPARLSSQVKIFAAKIADIREAYEVLSEAAQDPMMFMMRGKVKPEFAALTWGNKRKNDHDGKFPPMMEDASNQLLPFDLDDAPAPEGWEADPEGTIVWAVREYLPEKFHNAAFCYELSSSSGSGKKKGLNVHLYFYLSKPALGKDLEAWLERAGAKHIDVSVLRTVQPMYIAAPVLAPGITDPFAGRRRGLVIEGRALEVDIDVTAIVENDDAGAGGQVTFKRAFTRRMLDELFAHCDLSKLDNDPAKRRQAWFELQGAARTIFADDPEEGFQYFNAYSRKYGGYKGEEKAREDWKNSEPGRFKGGTLTHWAKQLGNWQPSKEYTLDLVGGELDRAESSFKQWRYVAATKRFVNLVNFQELDKENFDASFLRLFSKGKPSDIALRNSLVDVIGSVTFAPNQERMTKEADEKGFVIPKLNLWRAPAVKASKGKGVEPFLAHVKYLYPDPTEANILLDYLAFNVQYPGEKILWSLLLQGRQGIGKTYVTSEPLSHCLGRWNIQVIPNERLHDGFNGWQRECSVVIVEELMARGRIDTMNKLKPMITEPWLSIREMYRPPYNIPNRHNWIFLTNHMDAISIDETDRRYCVLASEAVRNPNGNKYYEDLFAWTKANGPALLYYFGERKLDKFSPKGHAPMTEGKRRVIRENRTPLQEFIERRVEAHEWPFNVDLIGVDDMNRRVLPQFPGLQKDPKAIGRAFAELGYTFLGQRRIGEKNEQDNWRRDKVNLWAVRNGEDWLKLDSGQLRAAYFEQVNNLGPGSAAAPENTQSVAAETEPMGADNVTPRRGAKPN